MAIEYVADRIFSFRHNGSNFKMNYDGNINIHGQHPDIKIAIVAVHGVSQDSAAYARNAIRSSELSGQEKGTYAVIAPQFMQVEDKGKICSDTPYWDGTAWNRGDQSLDHKDISSFDVMNEILKKLADKNQFPNLEKVVIAGNSAGGQFVGRYASGGESPTELFGSDVDFSYVVMNSKSYMKFDPNISYKYGMKNLNEYMSKVGPAQLMKNFTSRDVTILYGEHDGNVDKGKDFYQHIQTVFGKDITETHKFEIVPDVGHGASAMFRSEVAQRVLFERAIVGDSKDNILKGTDGDDVIEGHGGNDILYGSSGNDTLYGGVGNDTLNGGEGNDTLYGGSGHDKLYGGDGDDVLYGGIGHDSLYGGRGNDTLHGGDGDDYFFGSRGNDVLYGDQGNDTLVGGSGNDILDGGLDNDTLTGGTGHDTFIFKTGYGQDIITDFNVAGTDRIDARGACLDTRAVFNALAGSGGDSSRLDDGDCHAGISVRAVGGDLVIDFGNDDTLTVLSTSSLLAQDFIFA